MTVMENGRHICQACRESEAQEAERRTA
jgi:hypothetical protein